MTTRHKGNEIAKPITPLSETASEEDSDHEQAQRDKDMQKNLALIAKYFKKIYKPTNNNLRTSSNSKNKNVDTTQRYKNDDHSGQFGTQRTVNVTGTREKVGSQVVQKTGIQCFNCKEYGHFAKECRKPKRVKDSAYHKEKMLLCKQAEQGVSLQAEQYDCYIAKIQEAPNADSGTNSEPVEQKANTTLAQELKECKISNTCLVETNDSNVTPDSPDMCEDDIQNDQNDVESDDERVVLANLIANLKLDTEFEKYKAFNDRTIDYDKLERKLTEALGQLAQKETVIREGLKTKAYELLEVKEKHDELMKQSLLTKSHYEGLVKQKTKAQSEISCLYALPYNQSTHANRLIPDREETLALERENRSKLNKDLVRPYDYTKLNSLYEIFKLSTQEYETQLAHANEIRRKTWQKSFVKSKPNIYKNVGFLPVSKLISKSRQAYNVMKNNINHFKQIVDDAWTKYSKDLFRAPTALDMEILIQTCLMPLAIKTQSDSLKFVHELKQEMHADLNKKDHTELLQHFAKVEKHSTSLELALQKCKEQIIQLILFIVDSGCTKNMTGNLKLLYNFVEKFMGTVRFGNDQFAPILGYGDLVQGNVTINKGNDLLTINRGSDLYTISLQESTSSTPLCLMAKATPTQAWLWQRRLSHLNFDYINLVSMKDIVIGLPKLKYVKDQLCSSCE
nr:hypothetical protein [Tanacetum cinerariifolium]